MRVLQCHTIECYAGSESFGSDRPQAWLQARRGSDVVFQLLLSVVVVQICHTWRHVVKMSTLAAEILRTTRVTLGVLH
jgi:hypothetical protein